MTQPISAGGSGEDARSRPRIGVLATGARGFGATMPALVNRLRDLGWVDGETMDVEYRYADGDEARLPGLAVELARLPLDAIVAAGGMPGLRAASRATSTIPIVVTQGVDPVGAGLAASLERPGGNVTGALTIGARLSAWRVQLLRAAFPQARRVAVIWNPTNTPAADSHRESHAAAAGLDLLPHPVRSVEEIAAALDSVAGERTDALLLLQDPLVLGERARFVEFAAAHHLPTMFPDQPFATDGGLMAVGQSGPSLYARAAAYVDLILRGARPQELPFVQPDEGYFVINVTTLREQAWPVPPAVIVQATALLF